MIGILPLIAAHYQVDISTAELLVGLFALAVSASSPHNVAFVFGHQSKKCHVAGVGHIYGLQYFSTFADDFTVVLIAHILPFYHFYYSLAFTVATTSVRLEEASKAICRRGWRSVYRSSA